MRYSLGCKDDVVIIGGGLAGLACANLLNDAGISFTLVEGSDAYGGRVQTDQFDGYRLDHGFQVLLTAYPEARNMLDYKALKLHSFQPGALIWFGGRFHRIADPLRDPWNGLKTLFSGVGTAGDLLKILQLRQHVLSGTLNQLFLRRETTTLDALEQWGFSDEMIQRFFRPFLGGIFLDPALETSSRMFEFVFRMFAEGTAALPAHGMGDIALQLLHRLPPHKVFTNMVGDTITDNHVVLKSGEGIDTHRVIVATHPPEAARILGLPEPSPPRTVTCFYFSTETPPIREPILILNGEPDDGPVNNMAILTNVSPDYAPKKRHLISVTVLGEVSEDDVENQVFAVREHLEKWFGISVFQWDYLRTYHIRYGLPRFVPAQNPLVPKSPRVREGIYICGDYCDSPSIHGALASGRRAAQAVIEDIRKTG